MRFSSRDTETSRFVLVIREPVGGGRERRAGILAPAGEHCTVGSTFRVVVAAALVCMVAVVGWAPGAEAVTGDLTPPDLVELVIEPRSVDTTDGDAAVELRARLTDDLSGVAWVRFQPESPSGQQTMPGFGVLETGTDRDGWWHATVTFVDGTEPGTWQTWVSYADSAGNLYTAWPERLADDGHDGDIEVSDDDPDLTAPVVAELTVSPAEVDVRDGSAQATVDFRVVDSGSGAREVYLNLREAGGGVPQADRTYPVRVSGDAHDGWWQSIVTVPEGAHDGHWTLVITMVDVVGNRADWGLDELGDAGLPDGFDVVSDADLDAPVLESLMVEPALVNVASREQAVVFELAVSDARTGVSYVQLDIRHPLTSQELHPPLTRVDGDASSGTYRGSITMPQHSPTGAWTIAAYVADKAANGQWLHSADLVALGMPGTLVVYNVPDAPVDVVATVTDGVLDLSWDPPLGDGGESVDGFRITVHPGGRVIDVGAPVTDLSVSGLAPGDYTVAVAARNAAGFGLPSTTSVNIPAPIAPPAPAEPVVVDPSPPPPSATPATGYWMVAEDGSVYAFGDAPFFGRAHPSAPAVDIEPLPSRRGYWVVDATGSVQGFGDAPVLSGAIALIPNERVVSLSATPTGNGYWLFTSRGRVLNFGDAAFLGDMGAVALNGPVLDSVATPSGHGYYMVAADGGVFTFGDARFAGSMGHTPLNAPVQSLVPDADGVGYWLVAEDGGIFSFDAPFHGSMGHVRLNRPVTGMVPSATGSGYLMVAEDGGIFTFGDVVFRGSLGATPPASKVVAAAAL